MKKSIKKCEILNKMLHIATKLMYNAESCSICLEVS